MTASAEPVDLATPAFGDLLDAIAAKQPTPGGGAVAAMTEAIGAALGSMVVAYSVGRKKLAAHAPLLERATETLAEHRRRGLELAARDAAAYAALNALWTKPADDPERVAAMPGAVREAIAAPAAAMDLGLETLDLLAELVGRTNQHLGSDLAIAAILADAAVRSAAWNVRINLPMLEDAAEADRTRDRMESGLKQSAARCREIEGALGGG